MNSQRVTATTTAWMGGRLAAIAVAATTTTTVATVLWMWWKRSNSGRTIEKENDDIIYLDFNGTTPVYPVVLDAMLPFFRAHFGNPGSAHALGDVPKAAVDAARRQILTHVLGCRTTNTNNTDSAAIQGGADTETPVSACVFTASGTESDNLAIHWALQRFHQQQQHQQQEKNSTTNDTNLHLLPNIVTSNVEHPAMEVCFAAHERAGRCTVTRVPVGPDGRVAAKDMIAAIQQQTILVSLMLANNETGALQPVKEVSEYCRKVGVLVVTDAAQAVGKMSVTLQDLGDPDMVTIVGHKFGAPKGIACLYVRPGCLGPGVGPGLLLGGGQEGGRRAGTENVPYIVGMGVAAEHCVKLLQRNRQHMEQMRQRLLLALQVFLGPSNVCVHGPTNPGDRLPNTLSVAFVGGVSSGKLLHATRDRVAASAGAACHSSAAGPVSAILLAMNIPEALARSTVRLSLGPQTTAEQVDRAAFILAQEVQNQIN